MQLKKQLKKILAVVLVVAAIGLVLTAVCAVAATAALADAAPQTPRVPAPSPRICILPVQLGSVPQITEEIGCSVQISLHGITTNAESLLSYLFSKSPGTL